MSRPNFISQTITVTQAARRAPGSVPPPPHPRHPPQQTSAPQVEEPAVVEVPAVEPAAPETVPDLPDLSNRLSVPSWKPAMKKSELLAIALSLGLDVSDDSLKADIVAALTSLTQE